MINLKYGFEYGNDHSCLSCINEEAVRKFGGYIVTNDALNIDDSLSLTLILLCQEYQSSLNWECPQDPSPWTREQKADFHKRSKQAYNDLLEQLGNGYDVIYDVLIPE